MGLNRPTWTPGRERHRLSASRLKRVDALRRRHERQAATNSQPGRWRVAPVARRAPRHGGQGPCRHGVGEVRDIVVNRTSTSANPPITGIVMRAGRRDVVIGSRWIELSPPASARLHSPNAYARAVERRPADVALAHDVLDHQLVDSAGIQIVRPSDIYLATVDGRLRAVGIEVGPGALLRRLGPRAASRPRPPPAGHRLARYRLVRVRAGRRAAFSWPPIRDRGPARCGAVARKRGGRREAAAPERGASGAESL